MLGCPTLPRIPVYSMIGRKKNLLVLICAAILLAGCYLPARFDAEIEFARNGFYKMTFEGYIVEVTLYNDIKQKKLTPEMTQTKIERVITDFKRDSGTKEISYFGQGAFKVKWIKSGDILRSRMVTFFRRNENMAQISFSKIQKLVTIRTKYVKRSDANQLNSMGLGMEGDLRVKTDARVLEHNAQKVTEDKKAGIKIYSWKIKNIFQKAPKMLVAFP
jgi:hypothetical protein